MHNYTASIYSDTRSKSRLTAEYFCSRDSINILNCCDTNMSTSSVNRESKWLWLSLEATILP